MGNDLATSRNWYFISPEAISRYLTTVIRDWGYKARWNQSDDSESLYIMVWVGTGESPEVFNIRISNHSVPPKRLWIEFKFDVYCGHKREGATNYVKLLSKLTEKLGKPLPPCLKRTKIGTEMYKKYSIEMQRRGKLANGRRSPFQGERLYVYG